jgi:copper(I)-binding protein
MHLANDGDAPNRLIGATSDAAAAIEIHETVDSGGVMLMRRLAGGLEMLAGATVALQPGGYHIMLIGLTGDLVQGETFELALEFETAGTVELEVPVFATPAESSADPAEPLKSGDLTISEYRARQAPAMGMNGAQGAMHGQASPATGSMHTNLSQAMAASTGAVFMTIANVGDEPDRLVSVTTEASETVEIHEVINVDSVTRMRPLMGGLDIPASSEVVLEPGGYHVMLIGLTADLLPDETFELTLTFEEVGEMTVVSFIVMGNDSPESGMLEPVVAGDITVSDVWSRAAPAIA